jgi:NCS2 family nucleobase:cation symporter-2
LNFLGAPGGPGQPRPIGFLARLARRAPDRPRERPGDIAHDLDESPPPGASLALALQQLAIQSIYFLLPGIVGSAFGLAPIDTTYFLCMTVAVLGLTALVQTMRQGPVGSGYALPSIPSPVFFAVYLLVAESGSLMVAGILTAVAGLLGLVLSGLLRRLQALIPTEVAGVVVFLIGVSLLPRAFDALDGSGPAGTASSLAMVVALGALGAMMVVALSHGRWSRFGVLIGAALGCAVAVPSGLMPDGAMALLEVAPWFALPQPKLPALAAFDWVLLPAFAVALLASFASWTGDLVAFQRASDGDWRRPDPQPIRRGLAAQSFGLVAAGLLGGMAPSSSSACVGLAIATRTLSRSVTVVGSLLLLALACCPKLVALFVLVPDPVKAAMLAYVCCFMMASGCQLMTTRMLDARRTFTIGLGLAVGLGVLIAPGIFVQVLPRALQAPVTAGTFTAVLLNLLTLPLVSRRARITVTPGPRMQQGLVDQLEALGGAWGSRRETMERVKHALLEIGEILVGRGVSGFGVEARLEEEQVALLVSWSGDPLPAPSARPNVDDLLGPMAAQEAFAMWMATRGANAMGQRRNGATNEMRLEFSD